MLLAAWIFVGFFEVGAAGLEFDAVLLGLGRRARNDGKWVVVEKYPHEESGRDFYASWGVPWLGTCITIALILSVPPIMIVWLRRASRVVVSVATGCTLHRRYRLYA